MHVAMEDAPTLWRWLVVFVWACKRRRYPIAANIERLTIPAGRGTRSVFATSPP